MGFFSSSSPKSEKSEAAIVAEAQTAWDSGRRYFTPAFSRPADAYGSRRPFEIADWAKLLEAVESVGWRLHTWQTDYVMNSARPPFLSAVETAGIVVAHPLFVRA